MYNIHLPRFKQGRKYYKKSKLSLNFIGNRLRVKYLKFNRVRGQTI